jgi:hypothetical protein
MKAKDFKILEWNYNFEIGFNKANFRQFLSSIHLSLRQKKFLQPVFSRYCLLLKKNILMKSFNLCLIKNQKEFGDGQLKLNR